ncbi:MAG: FMN-binding protein [Actinomycetales bacterium]|nr:FMN-binding protein [Candidatus Phosphoribacter baldrii]
MRRIVTWALSTITTLVLLMSYHTSTSSTASTIQASGATAGTGSKGTAPGAAGSAGSAGTGKGTTGGASGSGSAGNSATGLSFAGAAVPTRFGNVQVQITVVDKKITAATVLQIPNRDRKDVQINNRAVPILNAEAVQAQSADIDMVSGATVTSVAYIQSLQSAIDKANL